MVNKILLAAKQLDGLQNDVSLCNVIGLGIGGW